MNKFNFSSGSLDVDVEWDENQDGPIEVVIAEAITKSLKEEVKTSGYHEQYPVYQNTDYSDDHSQGKTLEAIKNGITEHQKYLAEYPDYKDGPKPFILQQIEEAFEDSRVSASDSAYESFGGSFDDDLSEALVESLQEFEDEYGIEKEKILESLCQWDVEEMASLSEYFRDTVTEALEENDTTSINDFFDSIGKIPMLYTTIHDDNMHDSMVECRNNTGDVATIVPDHKFEAFLKMINMPPVVFAKAAKDDYDVDYLANSEDKEQWQELLDKSLVELGINPKRKPAVTPEMAVELIDNMTSGYGLPTFGVNLTVDQIIDMNKDKHFLFTEGGQIGLHDYINGAGHMETATGPVLLPQDINQWHQADGPETLGYYDFNDCYGMMTSAFNADVKTVEVQKSAQMEMDAKSF